MKILKKMDLSIDFLSRFLKLSLGSEALPPNPIQMHFSFFKLFLNCRVNFDEILKICSKTGKISFKIYKKYKFFMVF